MLRLITAEELYEDTPTCLNQVIKNGDVIRVTSEYGNAVLVRESAYLQLKETRDKYISELADSIVEKHLEALKTLADYDFKGKQELPEQDSDADPVETVEITVSMDKDIKDKAEALFARLGIDMNTAIEIFLRNCIEMQGIPFRIGLTKLGTDGVGRGKL